MKLQSHSVGETNLPDLEVKVSVVDILRRILDEGKATLRAEIGQRENNMVPGAKRLYLAYEHLELAGVYLLMADDENRFDLMKEVSVDQEASNKLEERVNA